MWFLMALSTDEFYTILSGEPDWLPNLMLSRQGPLEASGVASQKHQGELDTLTRSLPDHRHQAVLTHLLFSEADEIWQPVRWRTLT